MEERLGSSLMAAHTANASQEAPVKLTVLGNTQRMITTKFTQTRGFCGYRMSPCDGIYQGIKHHSQHKSCTDTDSLTPRIPFTGLWNQT